MLRLSRHSMQCAQGTSLPICKTGRFLAAFSFEPGTSSTEGALMRVDTGDRSGERRLGAFPSSEERQYLAHKNITETSLPLVHGALARHNML